MDKKLNRQIGYTKPKTVKTTSAKADNKSAVVGYTIVKKEEPPLLPEVIRVNKTKKIIAWIKKHPMFAWGRMCVLLEINKGNFSQTLKSKTPSYISSENIEKIEHVISDYGYEK